MMFTPYLLVAAGGTLGAISRYVTVLYAQNKWGQHFPYGTLIVNTLGSFLAGFFLMLLVGRFNAGEYWRLFLFTGFLGAFTTFSSFSAESLALFEQSQWLKLVINILANNLGSFTMILLGAFIANFFIFKIS